MTITYDDKYITTRQLQNIYRHTPGCSDPVVHNSVNEWESYNHRATYVPEHRTYPDDVTKALTSREYVYERSGNRGDYFKRTEYPCSHGTHTTIYDAYRTGILTKFSHFGYDYSSLKAEKRWALKLREKIHNQRVNLGSSVAEYRESGKMFVNLAKGLHTSYRILRGRIPRKKIRACSIPASVLQYNFGVAPLVSDLYSSVETLRQRLDKPLQRRFSVGYKHRTNGSGNVAGFDVNWEGDFKQRATIYCDLDLEESYIDPDLDFGNPIEWAWELIPFSFVVDWAIPIGEWLGALDALKGVSNIRGTVTTKTNEGGYYFWDQANNRLTPGSFHSRTYEREVISTVPLPPFPKWEPSLSFKRILNGVSLLGTMSDQCRKGR